MLQTLGRCEIPAGDLKQALEEAYDAAAKAGIVKLVNRHVKRWGEERKA